MGVTTHAVILAAGLGSRLDAPEGHKLLAEIGGRSLLTYHLDGFKTLGVEHVTVVSGYKAEDLQQAIEAYETDLDIRVVVNTDYELSNGLSVLSGDPGEPFWLTMADHIFDPAMYEDLRAFPGNENPEGALIIDKKIDTIYDLPDATLLDLTGPDAFRISKLIEPFDLVDCGLFWADRPFIDALQEALDARGDCSTSDAVKALHAKGTFTLWDIGERLWQDVDTPGAREHAEKLVKTWFG